MDSNQSGLLDQDVTWFDAHEADEDENVTVPTPRLL